ncbi:hypothetical protein COLO4_04882 [Corchorus olitorius]|uniref:Uncharacterized protein n=1 Tax=Corchorus olitorius TaxID=93759 RepID=A0A1R3KSK3_9ROSI|nr:hypothetical protein COLO4_04882 [Corchorus olitorius]
MGEDFLVFEWERTFWFSNGRGHFSFLNGRGQSVEDESLCERKGGNSVVDKYLE